MNRFLHNHLIPLVAALALSGCSRDTAAELPRDPEGNGAPESNAVLTLSPASMENINLSTEAARVGPISLVLKTVGRVSFDLNRTTRIDAPFEGRLLSLKHDLNDAVRAGDAVAVLAAPDLLGREFALTAPSAGIVVERSATAGEWISKGRTVVTLSDPDHLWLIAEVNERDIARVSPGQTVRFTVLAYPERTFAGKVALVGNRIEDGSRTLEARIEVDNTARLLKAGMFADVAIETSVLPDVLTIPDSALQTDGANQVVFVALGSNRFERRVVTLGVEEAGRVQVVTGVHLGEQVVTDGGFILKSEQAKGQLGEE